MAVTQRGGRTARRLANVFAVMVVMFGSCEGFWFGFFGDQHPPDLCKEKCKCPQDIINIEMGMDCRDAGLTELPEDLQLPVGLYRADFSRNSLTSLDPSTFALPSPSLTHLDLSDNRLGGLPAEGFGGLGQLEVLLLSNNVMTGVDPEAFRGLGNLTQLDLSYNKLHQLPDAVFADLVNLEKLIIAFNPLVSLPAPLLSPLSELQHLDLSGLGLTSLYADSLPSNLTKVHWLSLSHNHLDVVPTASLRHFAHSLQHLDLTGNPFTSLGSFSFLGLVSLRSLVLEQLLWLKTIDKYAFGDLIHLDNIRLRYLPRILQVDPKAFYGLGDNNTEVPLTLEDFTFSFSTLATLPSTLLPWDRLKYVSLEYNHWNCDCNMRWVKNSSLINMAGDRMVCSHPLRLRGHKLKVVPEKELTCQQPETFSTGETVGFLWVLIIIGLSASLATVSMLVYYKQGWVCRRPHGAYTSIERGSSTITIREDFDSSTA